MVERNLAKVEVASSILVFRSTSCTVKLPVLKFQAPMPIIGKVPP